MPFWSARTAYDLGLIDGIADVRSRMQELHGAKVKLVLGPAMLVSSLDMHGFSLSLLPLTPDFEKALLSPAAPPPEQSAVSTRITGPPATCRPCRRLPPLVHRRPPA